jgi:hypothetical protein
MRHLSALMFNVFHIITCSTTLWLDVLSKNTYKHLKMPNKVPVVASWSVMIRDMLKAPLWLDHQL